MRHLNRIRVKGFRAIDDEIEFEPSGINVITGRNNMGKTSLMESIATASERNYLFHHDQLRFLVNQSCDSAEVELESDNKFKVSFEVPDEQRVRDTIYDNSLKTCEEKLDDQTFSENERAIQEKINSGVDNNLEDILRNSICINYGDHEVLYIDLRSISMKRREDNVLKIEEDSTEREFNVFPHRIIEGELEFSNISTSLLNERRERAQHNLLRRSDSAIKEKIEEYIREKDLVDDFVGIQDNDIVVDREEGYEPIPIENMGSGFRSIYALLHRLHASKDNTEVMLFEEPELHQHPGYLIGLVQFLVDFVREEDLQLFLTTHNADLIKEFLNEKTKSDEDIEFLQDELNFINIREETVKEYDYESAEKALKEDMMDLRGV